MTTASLQAFFAEHVLLERLAFATAEFTVLALVVGALGLVLRPRYPRVVALLWLVVMVKGLVRVSLGSPLSLGLLSAPEPPPLAAAVVSVDAPPSQNFPPKDAFAAATSLPAPDLNADYDAVSKRPVARQPRRSDISTPPIWTRVSWGSVCTWFWLIAAGLFGTLRIGKQVSMRRLARRAEHPGALLYRCYATEAARLGLRRCPQLRVSQEINSPAILGVVNPVVLVPRWMADAGDEVQLGWILRHELMHSRMRDTWANGLRMATETLFFFNPAAWWAGRSWNVAMEEACDCALLSTDADKTSYAEQLFRIVNQMRDRGRRPAAGGLYATRTQIGRRIERILNAPLRTASHTHWLCRGMLLSLAALACAIGLDLVRPAQQARGETGATLGPPPARIVQFPEDHSMGTLYVQAWDTWQSTARTSHTLDQNWQPYEAAQGAVAIPEGMAVRLVPEGSAVYDLYPLASLGADDIQSIDFRRTEIQDDQVQYIEGMRLNELLFEHTEITDRALDYIDDMTSLQYLGVGRTQVTNAGIPALRDLTELRGLDLNLTGVTDEGMAQLHQIRNLESLDLWMANISDTTMSYIGTLTNLHELGLEGTAISTDGMQHLANLRALQILNLAQTAVSDEGLAHLVGLRALQYLDLRQTNLSDDSLRFLKQLHQLGILELPLTISPEALAKLSEALGLDLNRDAPRLEVRVVGAASKRPVPEAFIEFQREDSNYKPSYAWTGADGAAVIYMSAQVRFTTIYAEGYTPQQFVWDAAAAPEVTFELQESIVIGGIVIDGERAGVADAVVTLPIPGPRDFTRGGLTNHVETTGEDGRWTCAHAPNDLSALILTVTHPEHADTVVGAPDLSPQALKNLTQEIQLDAPLELTGRVVTPEGAGIPFAVVTQLERRRQENILTPTDRTATSDEEGQFRLAMRREGPVDLKTGATGFPPDVRVVEVTRDMNPIEIVLTSGAQVKGRVVDSAGTALADVMVRIGTTYERVGSQLPADAIAPWHTTTDTQGRFVWSESPDADVTVTCRKEGYMPAEQVLEPTDAEHVIVLREIIAIVGAVVDDETGEPVHEYAVSLAVAPSLDSEPGPWESVANVTDPTGEFRVAPGYSPYYVLRIEADGYLPGTSERFAYDKGEIRRDFRLTRAVPITGVIVGVDGVSVQGATVGVATAAQPIRLTGDPPVGFVSGTASTTDADGRFSLAGCEEPYVIVAVHSGGYAFVAHPDHENGGAIALQGWRQVTGIADGIRAAGETAVVWMLWYGIHGEGIPGILITQTIQGLPGESFEFKAAPALPVAISRHIVHPGAAQSVLTHQETVDTRDAEVTHVDMSTGTTVTGNVTGLPAPELPSYVVVEMTRTDHPWPDRFDVNRMSDDELARFAALRHEDPAWREAVMNSQMYGALVGEDGTFRIDGVDAGTYHLRVLVLGIDAPRAAETTVEIPDRVSETLDIGTIAL